MHSRFEGSIRERRRGGRVGFRLDARVPGRAARGNGASRSARSWPAIPGRRPADARSETTRRPAPRTTGRAPGARSTWSELYQNRKGRINHAAGRTRFDQRGRIVGRLATDSRLRGDPRRKQANRAVVGIEGDPLLAPITAAVETTPRRSATGARRRRQGDSSREPRWSSARPRSCPRRKGRPTRSGAPIGRVVG